MRRRDRFRQGVNRATARLTRLVPEAWRRRFAAIDRSRWRSRAKVLVLTLVGASVALALFGQTEADIGPFDATLSARPATSGSTTVQLAPLGDISFETHAGPLRVDMRVDQISYDEAQRIAENPERIEELGDDVADELAGAFRRLAFQAVVVTIVGGTLGAYVARHDWRAATGGALTSVVLVVAVGGITAATFNTQSVSEPRYSGLLTMTDRAVGDVESILSRYDEYSAQLSDLVGNMVTLYLAAEGLPVDDPRDDTVRVLHISDLHLSFHALDVVDRLATQFDVDVIADTGDSTDWGTPLEDGFIEEFSRFNRPYVWIGGNHDSAGTQRAVEGLSNTIVLDEEARTVGGIRFWGAGDPRFTPDQQEDLSLDDQRTIAEDFAFDVREMVEDAPGPAIDVVMVHDPRMAEELGGVVPLALAGHTHSVDDYWLGDDDETLVLVEGSTGGAGLRGLQGEEPEPMTATVLYFDPEASALVAYDRILIEGLGGGATIERQVVMGPDDDADTDEEDADEQDADEESEP